MRAEPQGGGADKLLPLRIGLTCISWVSFWTRVTL